MLLKLVIELFFQSYFFVFFALLSKSFPQSKEESISFGESLISFVDFALVRAYCQFLAIYSIDYKKEIFKCLYVTETGIQKFIIFVNMVC